MQVFVANLHYCALQVTEKQIYNLLKPNKRLLYLEKRHTAISGNWITSADEPP